MLQPLPNVPFGQASRDGERRKGEGGRERGRRDGRREGGREGGREGEEIRSMLYKVFINV